MIGNKPAVKIILTDDDEDDRGIFQEAFQDLNIQNNLTMFSNGDELMSYLRSNTNDLPQLLFLDLNMPRKSGLQCLREIRRDKRLKDLLVAIYSTSSSEGEIAKSFDGGANLYIKKPAEYNKLKNIIRQVVENNWQVSRRNRSKFFFNL